MVNRQQLHSVEEAIEWLHSETQRLLYEGRTKPILVDIIGWPNAGKTYFINQYMKRFQKLNDHGVNILSTKETTEERDLWVWERAANSDQILFHDPTGGYFMDLPVSAAGNRRMDIGMIIYNPRFGETENSSVHYLSDEALSRIKCVISNIHSQKK